MGELNTELRRIRAEADATRDEIIALCAGMDEQRLLWRESPTRWSLAEILAHLAQTCELCLPALDKAIADARRAGMLSDGPFRQGIMGKIFVWYVEPPPVLRLPAPKPLVPVLKGSAEEALPAFLEWHQRAVARIDRANGIDLRRARFTSPFASFVKMDLLALFSVFTAHERRHIWQMKNLRERMQHTSMGEH